MPECPGCFGDGAHDFTDIDVPLQRLARVLGFTSEPLGVQTCSWCDGRGEVTEEQYRDLRAAAIATFDQFQAGVRDGAIKI